MSEIICEILFRNHRNTKIPEIGSTIYNTIPTGGDTFVDRSSDGEQNETGTCPMHKTDLGTSHSKSFNVSKYVSQTAGLGFLQKLAIFNFNKSQVPYAFNFFRQMIGSHLKFMG